MVNPDNFCRAISNTIVIAIVYSNMLGPNDPRVLRLRERQNRGDFENPNGGMPKQLLDILANQSDDEKRYIKELKEEAAAKRNRREALRNPSPISVEKQAQREAIREARNAAEAKRDLEVSQSNAVAPQSASVLTPASSRPANADALYDREVEAYGEAQAKRLLKVRAKRKNKAGAAVAREQEARQEMNNRLADRALKPWEDYERSGTDPSFYNRNQQEWVDHQNRIMEVARQGIIDGNIDRIDSRDPDVRYLMDQIGDLSPDLDDNRVRANLNRALAGLNQGRDAITKELAYNEAGAAADEKLGLGALALSGFDDLGTLNSLNSFATDLQGRFAGERLLIDSQKMRGQNNISIGALMNVENEADLDAFLRSDPGRSVLESLQQLMQGTRQGNLLIGVADENKLMQTLDPRFNPNPSTGFVRDADLKGKDALLLSERGGYVPNDPLFQDGPYNATQAEGLYLMDLNALREKLGNMSYEDLLREGADLYSKRVPRQRKNREREAQNRGNQLYDVSLSLPRSIATDMQGNLPAISEEALRRFVL